MKESSISRRDLIKGSVLAGAGALAAGALAACTPGGSTAAGGGAGANLPEKWDREVDVLAIGSSGAAYGALSALNAGASSVLVVEKGNIFGGTTSLSGGGHWTPCNHVMADMGIEDNRNDALAYLEYLACGKAEKELQESYIDNSLAFIDWTMEKGYVWEILLFGTSQDYAPETVIGVRPLGRSISINDVTTVKNVMGEDIEHSYLVASNEFKTLRYLLEQGGAEIMMQTAGKRLITDSSGAVVGAVIGGSSGSELNVKVNKGVILGTGGFDGNGEMCTTYLGIPYYTTYLVPECTGDGHRMGIEAGAKLANMSSVYGQGTFLDREPNADGSMIADPGMKITGVSGLIGKPNALVVNSKGQRIGNESAPYGNWYHAFEAWDTTTLKPTNIPAYMICDSTWTQYYQFKGASGFEPLPLGETPDYVFKFDTIDELAEHFGIDKDGLNAQLAEFNANAALGLDPIWHRGENTYDKLNNGDTSQKRTDLINNCLGPVETPPFYCTKIYPATLGTAGGLKINGKAQVLDMSDQPIPGLYACGCTAGSPFGPAYPGGGGPVGSTCTMGYVAGRVAMGAEVK
jgi:succinate dehydrogenase/fumarate reductase flavoprotein subunit